MPPKPVATTPDGRQPLARLRRHRLNPRMHASDLRALAQLITLATTGVTDIAEGVHRSVLGTIGLPVGRTAGRTSGLTGFVYGSVRTITRLVGHSIDRLMRGVQTVLPADVDAPPGSVSPQSARPESAQREALLAALNGVLGDRLAAVDSPFATPMSLRVDGQPLRVATDARPGQPARRLPLPDAGGRLLLIIHGLCMNDLQWRDGDQAFGGTGDCDTLARELGYTPLYLRYNTGLHVSQNGRELSRQLEQLARHWPVPIAELDVLAHSMGGLVIRSALHFAAREGQSWPALMKRIVFLGTPHHGAPLERAGNWVDVLLGATPWSAPFAKLGQLRSAGITDLRHGFITDSDWHGTDRFRRTPDRRAKVPLPAGIDCFAIAATTAAKRSRLSDRLIGDGLVPLDSALGRHQDPERRLAFDAQSCWVAYRTNHMALLRDPAVLQQVRQWLAPGSPAELDAGAGGYPMPAASHA